MIICYIAGAYSSPDEYQVKKNIARADQLGMDVTKRFSKHGVGVLIPHNNTAHWDGLESGQYFYNLTMELLQRCDACIYIDGDEESSEGTKREVLTCYENGKPVFPDTDEGFRNFEEWVLSVKQNS